MGLKYHSFKQHRKAFEEKRLSFSGRSALTAGMCMLLMAGCSNQPANGAAAYSEGTAYLDAQAGVDPAAVMVKIEEKRKAAAIQEDEASKIASGDVSIFSLMNNAVVIGDSRAVGFSGYGYMPQDRVFAKIGASISSVSSYAADIARRQPEWIILAFGMNDLLISYPQGYQQAVQDQAAALQAASPSSKIIISSIIPASPSSGRTELIDPSNYNAQLAAACQENGWYFIDCSPIVSPDIYEPDGVHFIPSFYPVWAAWLMQASNPMLAYLV